jgi:hypothetical protein
VDWQNSTEAAFGPDELEREPAAEALFGSLPAEASKAKSYSAWSRDLVQWLYGTYRRLTSRSARPLHATGVSAIPQLSTNRAQSPPDLGEILDRHR